MTPLNSDDVLYTTRLEDNFVAALPGFHAFTGCHQTGTISGKSEVSCWNTLKKAEQQVFEAFASLSSSVHIQDDVAMRQELYICHLNAPSSHITTVKEMVLVRQEAVCRGEVTTNEGCTRADD